MCVFQMILHYKRTINKDHDGENCIICGDYGKDPLTSITWTEDAMFQN
jgi:hypothetical protein